MMRLLKYLDLKQLFQDHSRWEALAKMTNLKRLNCCSRFSLATIQFFTRIFQEKFGIVNFHHYLFLALLGIITAILATLVDLIAYMVIDCKKHTAFTKK